ncbi:MAG: AraC family transcriptional regulator [Alphaproteobacteria bacterium]|nr:AraC family transcriptional regulator [Alphaproteobacteria bacterium]
MERRAALSSQRQVFATRDPEEARAFVALRGYVLDVPAREASGVDMQLDGVYSPGFCLLHLGYGAAAEVRTTRDFDDYRLAAPSRGCLGAVLAGDEVAYQPGSAMLVSPTLDNVVRVARDTAALNIILSGVELRRQLGALLGEPLKPPLEFAARLGLREGWGRSLARFGRLAMAELRRTQSILAEPIIARSFREFVMAALLLHQPHSYTEALLRLERPIMPRDVKRAIDYIEANLDTIIGLPEIVAACGVPGRTLIKHFQDFKGTSPMRYMRAARYQKVREGLSRAEPEESIGDIAARWGFSHMGRFSVEYRRRFGENPSETLRKRRSTLI